MGRPRTPDELLRAAEAEERTSRMGRLKIFLGYAAGVGKSYRMLDEARRRRERGQDVVVGAVQPVVPDDVASLLPLLEIVPLKREAGRTVMDTEAILRRRPALCVIDGLAYDNPPGSRNPTRWQDVVDLRNHGISVLATINVQYVQELRSQVEAITSKPVQETVPVAFLQSADEIEIVDAPVGDPGTPDPRSLQLSKLREIALVLAAEVVEHQLADYLARNRADQHFGTHERILVCITPRTNIQEMLASAKPIAEKFHGDLIVAYVDQPGIRDSDRAALDAKLALAREAGATIEILHGEEPVEALIEFAESVGVTQLFIGHSQRSGWWSRVWGNPVDRLILRSKGMDVRVFPQ